MIGLNYRLDFVRLAGEEKPITGVEDGSTLYEVDTQVLYIFYKGIWYNQTNPESEASDDTNEVSNQLNIPEVRMYIPDKRSDEISHIPEVRMDNSDERSDDNEIIT